MSSRPHIHPAVPFLGRLPDPHPEIGEDARDAAKVLMAALDVACNRCYGHAMAQLERGQKRVSVAHRYPVTDEMVGVQHPAPGVLHTRSATVGGQQQKPGPAEAVYADMLWCTALLITSQAAEVDVDPVDHAAGYAQDFLGPDMPAEWSVPAELVLTSVVSLVGQMEQVRRQVPRRVRVEDLAGVRQEPTTAPKPAGAVAALELAQGVTTVGDLMGIDGHTMLMQQTEMAIRVAMSIAHGDMDAR